MAFVEFHLLQNFAPSNLNRDDTNTPKTCMFGGYRRARISSQCQKRQIRLHPAFEKAVQDFSGDLGVRTKKLGLELKNLFLAKGLDDQDSAKRVENFLSLVELKIAKDSKDKFRTQYLLYLGKREIDALKMLATDVMDLLADEKAVKADKALAKKIKGIFSTVSIAADIALFGRMVADSKSMNVEAACQVAHALSTNEVKNELDFFTAVDDTLEEDEQGSGMMGMVAFNSACYYRYSQINLNILAENLGEENKDQVKGAVLGFYRALLASTPSGKQSSFAAHNPPSYVRVVIRDGGTPWPLTNAFNLPIRALPEDELSIEMKSAQALEKLADQLKQMYSDTGFIYEGMVSYLDIPTSVERSDTVNDLEVTLSEKLEEVLQ